MPSDLIGGCGRFSARNILKKNRVIARCLVPSPNRRANKPPASAGGSFLGSIALRLVKRHLVSDV